MRPEHLILLAAVGAASLTGCSSGDGDREDRRPTSTTTDAADEATGLPPLDDDADLRILVRRYATDDQLDGVRAALAEEPAVVGVDHLTLHEAAEEYADRFPDEEPPDDLLLPFFRVDLAPTEDTDHVVHFIRELRNLPGVYVLAVDPEHRPVGFNAQPPAGEVIVFFEPGADSDEIADVRRRVVRSSTVADVSLETQEDALATFQRFYADDPVLLALTTAYELPASMTLTAAGDPAQTLAFGCTLRQQPQVREVVGTFAGAGPCRVI